MPSLHEKCGKCEGSLSFCQVKMKGKTMNQFYQYCASCERRLGNPVAIYIVRNHGFNPFRLPVVPLNNTRRSSVPPKVKPAPVELPEDIKAIRAMPYALYLQTDHWKKMRKIALERAAQACQLCNAKGILQVHHRTYERLGCELPEDLTVLCRGCHKKHHGK